MKMVILNIFHKTNVQYFNKLFSKLKTFYNFYQKEQKLEKWKKLCVIVMQRNIMLYA